PRKRWAGPNGGPPSLSTLGNILADSPYPEDRRRAAMWMLRELLKVREFKDLLRQAGHSAAEGPQLLVEALAAKGAFADGGGDVGAGRRRAVELRALWGGRGEAHDADREAERRRDEGE